MVNKVLISKEIFFRVGDFLTYTNNPLNPEEWIYSMLESSNIIKGLPLFIPKIDNLDCVTSVYGYIFELRNRDRSVFKTIEISDVAFERLIRAAEVLNEYTKLPILPNQVLDGLILVHILLTRYDYSFKSLYGTLIIVNKEYDELYYVIMNELWTDSKSIEKLTSLPDLYEHLGKMINLS